MSFYEQMKEQFEHLLEVGNKLPRDLHCAECGSEAVGIKPLTSGEANFHCHCVKCKHEWFEKTAARTEHT